MATTPKRTVKTPGATTPESTVEDVQTQDQTTGEQPAETTTPEQTATDSTESEPTVDHAARVAELEQLLADTEAKNKALEGQIRRAGTTKADAVPTDGSPYLSDKGWTRGA